MNARTQALAALLNVFGKRQSLTRALPEATRRLTGRDRALAQELAYGVLRWSPQLQAVTRRLLEKPVKAKDLDIHISLLMGLYQLLHTRVPPHAAVDESVTLIKHQKPWARGVVNGVLRRFDRERATIMAELAEVPEAHLAHPSWLLDKLEKAWPNEWQDIAAANNEYPPMSLRVNARINNRDSYRDKLRVAGLGATDIPGTSHGLTLATPAAPTVLPGFAGGEASVQDGAGQFAAGLLELAPGQRVLDACAAPGGKTAHMLESVPDLDVLALDVDAERNRRIRENLHRLKLTANVVTGDALKPDGWFNGATFDRILLDAPCSATGVIRRHPDIKELRRAEDISNFANYQAEMLRSLWPLLAPSGVLVYATCSVLPEENETVVDNFVSLTPDCQPSAIDAAWGRALKLGRQLLPGDGGLDGFYYARLRKH